MAIVVGDTITDRIPLFDSTGTAITGVAASIQISEAIDPDGDDFSSIVTISEIGGGWYMAEWTVDAPGTWSIGYIYPGPPVQVLGGEGFDVDGTSEVIYVSVTPSTSSRTLWELRASIARLCDDWVEFVATEDSADTSVMIDNIAGVENDEHFRGSEVWFKNDEGTASNRGRVVRCTSSSRDAASISLGSGLVDPPAEGDVAYLFNIGGEGTRIRTLDASINDAIMSLGVAGTLPYEEELSDAWDQDVSWVDIPSGFTHIGGVYYEDDYDNFNEVPSHGWEVDLVGKRITLAPEFAVRANDQTVRLSGRTSHPKLTDDDDTTDIDFGWLTKEVAAQILLKKHDQIMVNKGGMMKNEADALLGRAGVVTMDEGLIRVR